MKVNLSCILVIALLGCNSSERSEKKVTITDGTKTHEVYKPSEMSSLMKGMYAYNEQLKAEIEEGSELSSEFPDEFLKIHSAELSETKLRNETFEHFSGEFVDAQRQVFLTDSEVPVKDRYNNAINVCLSCHKTECTGPIPKIKKLLIK